MNVLDTLQLKHGLVDLTEESSANRLLKHNYKHSLLTIVQGVSGLEFILKIKVVLRATNMAKLGCPG